MLDQLKPTRKINVIDLLDQAGVDTSDWKNFDGDHPSQNPKYCYNWSFEQPGEFIVVCLWLEDIRPSANTLVHDENIRLRDGRLGGKGASVWKRRAREFDSHIRLAYRLALPVRVIVLDGVRRDHLDPDSATSKVGTRLLDPVAWAITQYDQETGDCLIVRGASPIENVDEESPEYDGFEVEARKLFVLHRRRERSLRATKLEAVIRENGALVCEVPRCGFDFKARYGDLGEGFAHVHHLLPLSQAPKDGRSISLKDLAVVCPNCHAMVHRGGECRPLETLIP